MSQGKTIRLKRLIEPQYGSCIIYALYREVYDALQEPFRKAAKR